MKIAQPEEQVADSIVEEVKKTALLDAASLAKLRALLISGASKAEDWRFLLESAHAKSAAQSK